MKEYIVPVCDDEKDYGDELIRCKDCKHRDPEDKKCDCGHPFDGNCQEVMNGFVRMQSAGLKNERIHCGIYYSS